MPKPLNLVHVWRQMEDVLFPALRLSTHERALYVHLLRHSRLEGRRTVRVSRNDLARAIGLCASTSRHYLRVLARKQVVRFLDRSALGCLLEILLPNEVTAGLAHSPASRELTCAVREVERDSAGQPRAWPRSGRYRGQRFRARILHREDGRCFYCRQVLPVEACRGASSDPPSRARRSNRHAADVSSATWALDHVIPVCLGGDSTSSNLVAACFSCNSQKGQLSAKDFVLTLRRKHVVTSTQFSSFLRRLRSLRP
jgi:5-methylcytosine-specific restriction endonuclease McrA